MLRRKNRRFPVGAGVDDAWGWGRLRRPRPGLASHPLLPGRRKRPYGTPSVLPRFSRPFFFTSRLLGAIHCAPTKGYPDDCVQLHHCAQVGSRFFSRGILHRQASCGRLASLRSAHFIRTFTLSSPDITCNLQVKMLYYTKTRKEI